MMNDERCTVRYFIVHRSSFIVWYVEVFVNDQPKIGVIVGREWSWPPAFIEEVNRRNAGATAEFVKLGGTRMNEPCPYAVIVDRISHEIPYYRAYLKNAVLQGAIVVNNPFWWSADDKFFGA